MRLDGVVSSPTILNPSACRSFDFGRLPARHRSTGTTSRLRGHCAASALAGLAELPAAADPEFGR